MPGAAAGAGCATRRARGRTGTAGPSASPQGQRLTHGCPVGGHFLRKPLQKAARVSWLEEALRDLGSPLAFEVNLL